MYSQVGKGGVSVNQSAATETIKRRKKNQMFILIALLSIVLLIGLLFVAMQGIATKRAAEHKQSFMSYVADHQLGTLIEIDTGTGLEPMSYVLEVPHPISDAEKESFALDMIQKYVQFDHGSTMTITYVPPGSKEQHVIANAHYDRDKKTATITVHLENGQNQTTVHNVNW